MEHFCAMLQNNLRSHSHPWSNLNKSVLHMAYLEQLTVNFDLSDELEQPDDRKDDGPIGHERVLDEYPDHILRPPYKVMKGIDPNLQEKIAQYIGQVIGRRSSEVKRRLPSPSLSAGKLRIRNGGDTFRTKQVCRRSIALSRRNFYVRYEVVFQGRTEAITQISYGDLEKIVILTTPIDPFFANLSGKSLALALITPWNTDGKLASKENVYMTTRKASIVTDIRSLKAVVGLVETRKKWGVIDRVPATVVTSFTEDNVAEDSDSEDEIGRIAETSHTTLSCYLRRY
ncbi:hypothetical protein PAXRUDRAFT_834023 [Paxillus rubicundulus Ve08.2h10]|uniref:Uncharacterized protein n=1 Tax=Paxillus rubicundulus Ve08.2h10 TaxID=930991 RepID=A0A0D0DF23_9AGAM|nr:hypothetical protein PAXRUDRAFT_834023 [Paxillus rubicundulus Ve08.2h10]